MDRSHAVEVLVISGGMGSGKTSLLIEASDLLTAAGIPHAAIDFDMLAFGHWPDRVTDLSDRNLAAVWSNYAAAGIDRLLISEAIDTADTLSGLRAAIPGATFVVCRLHASLETMRERVRQREPGIMQQHLVERVSELMAALDAAQLEDFSVVNEGRSITEVAREVLQRAGWIATGRGRSGGSGG